MEPIQAVGVGMPSRGQPITPNSVVPTGSTGSSGAASAAGAAQPNNAINTLMNQVTELLSGLGGGLESNQMLKLLLGLLILTALLSQGQDGQGQQQDAPSMLGGDGTGRGAMLQQSLSITSISISIEQTSITSLTVLPPGGFGDGAQDSGGQIDLAV